MSSPVECPDGGRYRHLVDIRGGERDFPLTFQDRPQRNPRLLLDIVAGQPQLRRTDFGDSAAQERPVARSSSCNRTSGSAAPSSSAASNSGWETQGSTCPCGWQSRAHSWRHGRVVLTVGWNRRVQTRSRRPFTTLHPPAEAGGVAAFPTRERNDGPRDSIRSSCRSDATLEWMRSRRQQGAVMSTVGSFVLIASRLVFVLLSLVPERAAAQPCQPVSSGIGKECFVSPPGATTTRHVRGRSGPSRGDFRLQAGDVLRLRGGIYVEPINRRQARHPIAADRHPRASRRARLHRRQPARVPDPGQRRLGARRE